MRVIRVGRVSLLVSPGWLHGRTSAEIAGWLVWGRWLRWVVAANDAAAPTSGSGTTTR